MARHLHFYRHFIAACLLLFALLVSTKYTNAQIVINEYSCSNTSTVSNAYGSYEDWVELYNTGTSSVSLAGYYMSDNPANPTKWQIPVGPVIAAGGRMMVYCDNMDAWYNGELHTSFKLNQTYGEKIILANSTGIIIDSSSLYLTQNNHSRGRTTDGAATWSLFPVPTPNAANSNSMTGYEPKVIFSVAGGFYTTSQSVTLNCTDATAQIRYTTNGQAPVATSQLYSGVISISSTTVLRAAAFPTNTQYLQSFDENNTYFINETIAPTMNIISLGGDYADMFSGANDDLNFLYGSFEFFDKTKQFKFKLEGEAQPHGNDSWYGNTEEKGFSFHARDQLGYDADLRYKFFNNSNRDSFDVIILKTGASDAYPGYHPNSACHLRDVFAETLAMKHGLDLDARKYEPTVVYINGQYWGIYEIRERVDDADYTEYYYGQKESKIDFLEYWGGMNVKYGSDTAWNNLYNFMMANDLTVPANYAHVTDRLDVASFIDYFILNTYLVDTDWLNWNTEWWRGRKSPGVKWKYSLWDEDNILNLGETWTTPNTTYNSDPCIPASLFQNDPSIMHTDMYVKLMTNAVFTKQYKDRYVDLLNSTFNCDTLIAHLNSILDIIQPEMQRHCTRWGASYTQWEANVDSMKAQIMGRCYVIGGKLDSCMDLNTKTLKLDVYPAGSGTIKLSGTTKSPYVWHQLVTADSTYTLQAVPASSSSVFDHWQKQQVVNIISPDTITALVPYTFNDSDSVVAIFRHVNTDSMAVSFKVSPVAAGAIKLEGTALPYYTFTQLLNKNSTYALQALPAPGYHFMYWGKQQATTAYNPDSVSQNAQFTFTTSDTLTAYFRYDPDTIALSFNVYPPASGTINLQGAVLPYYPVTEMLNKNNQYTLTATPASGYQFMRWGHLQPTTVYNPDTLSQNASFIYSAADALTAFFRYDPDSLNITFDVLPAGTGTILLNQAALPYYPYTTRLNHNNTYSLGAVPDAAHHFQSWSTGGHPDTYLLADSLQQDVTFEFKNQDTIIAHFRPLQSLDETVTLPTAFTPNGDGRNDYFHIVAGKDIQSVSLAVYNRWGEKVYSTNDRNFKWDGTSHGKLLDIGMYSYKLSINFRNSDGVTNSKTIVGDITLVR